MRIKRVIDIKDHPAARLPAGRRRYIRIKGASIRPLMCGPLPFRTVNADKRICRRLKEEAILSACAVKRNHPGGALLHLPGEKGVGPLCHKNACAA